MPEDSEIPRRVGQGKEARQLPDRVKEATMKRKDMQLLIVADDSKTIAVLAAEIVARLDANLTIVDTVREAGELMTSDAFDIVLAAPALSDGPSAGLVSSCATPIMLLDRISDVGHLLESFRAGFVDVIDPTADAIVLTDRIRHFVADGRRRKRTVNRNVRLRRVSSRLIKDRRELRQRVDLICRDLVQAYQRLAHKVVSTSEIGQADYPDDTERF